MLAPASEYHPDEQFVHWLALRPGAYVPSLQLAHTPVAEDVPGIHMLQPESDDVFVLTVV